MKFSVQLLLTLRESQTHPEVYAHALEESRLADALGFEAVWLAEHHFSVYGMQALDQAAIVGDPEEVADKIRAHHEALGVTHFMGAFSRGIADGAKVLRSMRLFGEKVMPSL
jgi:alkanesulfonate monooxygenase SsuD/methylene tetrahydromethanopterin reductase-like flavin-dependent oxidoreductase (luciferase family)